MKSLLKPGLIALAIVAVFAVASQVTGDECGGPYGGVCPKAEVLIDKLVWNPASDSFVDNLGTQDHKFTATQEVTFRLTVKNTSSVFIDKVDVFDILPAELEYVSGPGSYDEASREIRFEVKDLEANASRDYEVKAKVVAADRLPEDKNLICVINQAEARIPEGSDSDTSQLCIEKPVVGEMPETGPAEWIMFLTGSSILGTMGLGLIKNNQRRK